MSSIKLKQARRWKEERRVNQLTTAGPAHKTAHIPVCWNLGLTSRWLFPQLSKRAYRCHGTQELLLLKLSNLQPNSQSSRRVSTSSLRTLCPARAHTFIYSQCKCFQNSLHLSPCLTWCIKTTPGCHHCWQFRLSAPGSGLYLSSNSLINPFKQTLNYRNVPIQRHCLCSQPVCFGSWGQFCELFQTSL